MEDWSGVEEGTGGLRLVFGEGSEGLKSGRVSCDYERHVCDLFVLVFCAIGVL